MNDKNKYCMSSSTILMFIQSKRFICDYKLFQGYNCPGCFLAVHTKCLKRYLKKVQKWPCCKIDFNSEQLERLDNER